MTSARMRRRSYLPALGGDNVECGAAHFGQVSFTSTTRGVLRSVPSDSTASTTWTTCCCTGEPDRPVEVTERSACEVRTAVSA